jgi:3-methyladenine DNA glycosylase AlkC
MAELFKDVYNKKYIDLLCNELLHVDKKEFTCRVFDELWESRELKERMRHISTVLGEFLPSDYVEAINILKIVFLKLPENMGLEKMVFQDFVEVYGMDNFEKSMEALECFTKDSSSEFAVRRFIVKYPKETMSQMIVWASSNDIHVRRLASEGSRPRLPWAIALPKFKSNPKEVLEILEILKDDESEYVRRSVANNLNDISKDNPDVVKEITKNWIGQNQNRDKLLKHGCRTLLKASDRDTLGMFGFKKVQDIKVEDFTITKEVEFEKELLFGFTLNSRTNLGKLRIEYALHFVRQNNKYSKKVFKISEGFYNQISKKVQKLYSFKPISTRRYYNGLHKVEIIVNGEVLHEDEFIYN